MILLLPPINDGEGVEVLESRDDLGGVEESRGGGEVARSDCGHRGHHVGVVVMCITRRMVIIIIMIIDHNGGGEDHGDTR